MTLPEFHSNITELAQAYEARRLALVSQLETTAQRRLQLALKRALLSLDLCVSTLLTLETEWPRFASHLHVLQTELTTRQHEVAAVSRLRKRLLGEIHDPTRRESLAVLEHSLDSTLGQQTRGALRACELHRTLATAAYTVHIEALAALFDEDDTQLILDEIGDAVNVLIILLLQTASPASLVPERLTANDILAAGDRLLGWPTSAQQGRTRLPAASISTPGLPEVEARSQAHQRWAMSAQFLGDLFRSTVFDTAISSAGSRRTLRRRFRQIAGLHQAERQLD